MIGNKNPFFRKKHTEETKEIISQKNKNNSHEPWNKGKSGCFSDEVIIKMSESHKGRIAWNKGLKMDEEFCEQRKEYMKGRKNPAWKGGYSSNDIPLYETYSNQLTVDEGPERDKYDHKILTVLCANSNCKKRFIPSLKSVIERVRCLKGTQNGEMRLYCSNECKHTCSIYWTQPSSFLKKNNDKFYTDSEYKQFRDYVLKRDKYICEYCGKLAEYVHHERPKKLEPFFSLDPDLAWSVCRTCHYKYGHRDECSTANLANTIC